MQKTEESHAGMGPANRSGDDRTDRDIIKDEYVPSVSRLRAGMDDWPAQGGARIAATPAPLAANGADS